MFKELVNEIINQYDYGHWQSAVIISILIFAGSLTLHFITFRILKRLSKKSDKPFLKLVRDKLKNPSLGLILTIATGVILLAFAPDNEFVDIIMHLLQLFIIFFTTWVIIRLIRISRETILIRYDIGEKDNLKARRIYTQFKIIERILVFIVVVIAIAVALMTFEQIRKIGVSLFASAGVAGIIMGFAAQKMIGNVLAGFQIALAQPIRIDDVVIVEK